MNTQIGRQHGGGVVAGLGMNLEYLHPLQLGQGGGRLVQPVEVVADRTHAAHQNQAQGLVVMRRSGQSGGDQEPLVARVDCDAKGVCGARGVAGRDRLGGRAAGRDRATFASLDSSPG